VAGDTSFAKKHAKDAPLLFWVARRAKTKAKAKAPALLWHVDVLLFFGFPASAPVWGCRWMWWMWLMWFSWYFFFWWYWYYLSFCLWAFRLTPSVVFRLRCRSGLAKKPARLPSSPPNATEKATATAMTWTWEAMPKRTR